MLLLSVDQGVNAGWSIHRAGEMRPLRWGTTTRAAERKAVIDLLLSLAMLDVSSIYVITEDHSKMPLVRGTRHDSVTRQKGKAGTVNTATVLGMGGSAARWLEQAELAGVPLSHMRKLSPATWKSAILGKGWSKADKDAARAESVRVVRLRYGIEVEHDCAAAICIGTHQALALPAELERERAARRMAR